MNSVASLAAPSDNKPHDFAGVFALLAPHLAELERFLHRQLATFEPEIRAMADACMDVSARRIRSALVFLGGWRGPAEIAPELVRAAAVVEFVHLATFVHDDILGEAGRRAASREAGPTPAVLLGDALFAHGLYLATQFSTTEVCAAITEAARRVSAGQIVQTLSRCPAGLTRADYRRIADLKTAELFRVSCVLGARLAGSEPGYVEAAGRFGRHLGIAWQIHDDLADCFGEETRVGREPGAELAGGALTLPWLVLLERLPAPEAEALRSELMGERPPPARAASAADACPRGLCRDCRGRARRTRRRRHRAA